MDTIVTVETPTQDVANSVKTLVEELDNILDRHSEGTELYLLNTTKSIKDKYISELIRETFSLNQTYGYDVDITSGNLVDAWNISDEPTIPTESEISQALESVSIDHVTIVDDTVTLSDNTTLDVGSVAKGYALDVIASSLSGDSLKDTYITMGSSTLLYDVESFPIYVRSPEDTQSVVCKFSVNGTGYISTSGGYERYIEIDGVKYPHILDLNTGYPVVTDLTSVTVYTDSGIKSDFLSTYIYMGGTKSLNKYLNDDTIKIIAIDDQRNVYISEGFSVEILDDNFTIHKDE
jgi:thiamine biosynthesis lipoprotein